MGVQRRVLLRSYPIQLGELAKSLEGEVRHVLTQWMDRRHYIRRVQRADAADRCQPGGAAPATPVVPRAVVQRDHGGRRHPKWPNEPVLWESPSNLATTSFRTSSVTRSRSTWTGSSVRTQPRRATSAPFRNFRFNSPWLTDGGIDTIDPLYYTLRVDGSQQSMWVATADLPQIAGHPFYARPASTRSSKDCARGSTRRWDGRVWPLGAISGCCSWGISKGWIRSGPSRGGRPIR